MNGNDNAVAVNLIMVLSFLEDFLWLIRTSLTRLATNATGARVADAARGSLTGRLAYLRQSYLSRGFSPQATDRMLASWRGKTNSNYESSFSKWFGWY